MLLIVFRQRILSKCGFHRTGYHKLKPHAGQGDDDGMSLNGIEESLDAEFSDTLYGNTQKHKEIIYQTPFGQIEVDIDEVFIVDKNYLDIEIIHVADFAGKTEESSNNVNFNETVEINTTQEGKRSTQKDPIRDIATNKAIFTKEHVDKLLESKHNTVKGEVDSEIDDVFIFTRGNDKRVSSSKTLLNDKHDGKLDSFYYSGDDENHTRSFSESNIALETHFKDAARKKVILVDGREVDENILGSGASGQAGTETDQLPETGTLSPLTEETEDISREIEHGREIEVRTLQSGPRMAPKQYFKNFVRKRIIMANREDRKNLNVVEQNLTWSKAKRQRKIICQAENSCQADEKFDQISKGRESFIDSKDPQITPSNDNLESSAKKIGYSRTIEVDPPSDGELTIPNQQLKEILMNKVILTKESEKECLGSGDGVVSSELDKEINSASYDSGGEEKNQLPQLSNSAAKLNSFASGSSTFEHRFKGTADDNLDVQSGGQETSEPEDQATELCHLTSNDRESLKLEKSTTGLEDAETAFSPGKFLPFLKATGCDRSVETNARQDNGLFKDNELSQDIDGKRTISTKRSRERQEQDNAATSGSALRLTHTETERGSDLELSIQNSMISSDSVADKTKDDDDACDQFTLQRYKSAFEDVRIASLVIQNLGTSVCDSHESDTCKSSQADFDELVLQRCKSEAEDVLLARRVFDEQTTSADEDDLSNADEKHPTILPMKNITDSVQDLSTDLAGEGTERSSMSSSDMARKQMTLQQSISELKNVDFASDEKTALRSRISSVEAQRCDIFINSKQTSNAVPAAGIILSGEAPHQSRPPDRRGKSTDIKDESTNSQNNMNAPIYERSSPMSVTQRTFVEGVQSANMQMINDDIYDKDSLLFSRGTHNPCILNSIAVRNSTQISSADNQGLDYEPPCKMIKIESDGVHLGKFSVQRHKMSVCGDLLTIANLKSPFVCQQNTDFGDVHKTGAQSVHENGSDSAVCLVDLDERQAEGQQRQNISTSDSVHIPFQEDIIPSTMLSSEQNKRDDAVFPLMHNKDVVLEADSRSSDQTVASKVSLEETSVTMQSRSMTRSSKFVMYSNDSNSVSENVSHKVIATPRVASVKILSENAGFQSQSTARSSSAMVQLNEGVAISKDVHTIFSGESDVKPRIASEHTPGECVALQSRSSTRSKIDMEKSQQTLSRDAVLQNSLTNRSSSIMAQQKKNSDTSEDSDHSELEETIGKDLNAHSILATQSSNNILHSGTVSSFSERAIQKARVVLEQTLQRGAPLENRSTPQCNSNMVDPVEATGTSNHGNPLCSDETIGNCEPKGRQIRKSDAAESDSSPSRDSITSLSAESIASKDSADSHNFSQEMAIVNKQGVYSLQSIRSSDDSLDSCEPIGTQIEESEDWVQDEISVHHKERSVNRSQEIGDVYHLEKYKSELEDVRVAVRSMRQDTIIDEDVPQRQETQIIGENLVYKSSHDNSVKSDLTHQEKSTASLSGESIDTSRTLDPSMDKEPALPLKTSSLEVQKKATTSKSVQKADVTSRTGVLSNLKHASENNAAESDSTPSRESITSLLAESIASKDSADSYNFSQEMAIVDKQGVQSLQSIRSLDDSLDSCEPIGTQIEKSEDWVQDEISVHHKERSVNRSQEIGDVYHLEKYKSELEDVRVAVRSVRQDTIIDEDVPQRQETQIIGEDLVYESSHDSSVKSDLTHQEKSTASLSGESINTSRTLDPSMDKEPALPLKTSSLEVQKKATTSKSVQKADVTSKTGVLSNLKHASENNAAESDSTPSRESITSLLAESIASKDSADSHNFSQEMAIVNKQEVHSLQSIRSSDDSLDNCEPIGTQIGTSEDWVQDEISVHHKERPVNRSQGIGDVYHLEKDKGELEDVQVTFCSMRQNTNIDEDAPQGQKAQIAGEQFTSKSSLISGKEAGGEEKMTQSQSYTDAFWNLDPSSDSSDEGVEINTTFSEARKKQTASKSVQTVDFTGKTGYFWTLNHTTKESSEDSDLMHQEESTASLSKESTNTSKPVDPSSDEETALPLTFSSVEVQRNGASSISVERANFTSESGAASNSSHPGESVMTLSTESIDRKVPADNDNSNKEIVIADKQGVQILQSLNPSDDSVDNFQPFGSQIGKCESHAENVKSVHHSERHLVSKCPPEISSEQRIIKAKQSIHISKDTDPPVHDEATPPTMATFKEAQRKLSPVQSANVTGESDETDTLRHDSQDNSEDFYSKYQQNSTTPLPSETNARKDSVDNDDFNQERLIVERQRVQGMQLLSSSDGTTTNGKLADSRDEEAESQPENEMSAHLTERLYSNCQEGDNGNHPEKYKTESDNLQMAVLLMRQGSIINKGQPLSQEARTTWERLVPKCLLISEKEAEREQQILDTKQWNDNNLSLGEVAAPTEKSASEKTQRTRAICKSLGSGNTSNQSGCTSSSTIATQDKSDESSPAPQTKRAISLSGQSSVLSTDAFKDKNPSLGKVPASTGKSASAESQRKRATFKSLQSGDGTSSSTIATADKLEESFLAPQTKRAVSLSDQSSVLSTDAFKDKNPSLAEVVAQTEKSASARTQRKQILCESLRSGDGTNHSGFTSFLTADTRDKSEASFPAPQTKRATSLSDQSSIRSTDAYKDKNPSLGRLAAQNEKSGSAGTQRKRAIFESLRSGDATNQTGFTSFSTIVTENKSEKSFSAPQTKGAFSLSDQSSVLSTDAFKDKNPSSGEVPASTEMSASAGPQRKRATFNSLRSGDATSQSGFTAFSTIATGDKSKESFPVPQTKRAISLSDQSSVPSTDAFKNKNSYLSRVAAPTEKSASEETQRKRAIFKSLESGDTGNRSGFTSSTTDTRDKSDELSPAPQTKRAGFLPDQSCVLNTDAFKDIPLGEVAASTKKSASARAQRKRAIFKSLRSGDGTKQSGFPSFSTIAIEDKSEESFPALQTKRAISLSDQSSVPGTDALKDKNPFLGEVASPAELSASEETQRKRSIFRSLGSGDTGNQRGSTSYSTIATGGKSDESSPVPQRKRAVSLSDQRSVLRSSVDSDSTSQEKMIVSSEGPQSSTLISEKPAESKQRLPQRKEHIVTSKDKELSVRSTVFEDSLDNDNVRQEKIADRQGSQKLPSDVFLNVSSSDCEFVNHSTGEHKGQCQGGKFACHIVQDDSLRQDISNERHIRKCSSEVDDVRISAHIMLKKGASTDEDSNKTQRTQDLQIYVHDRAPDCPMTSGKEADENVPVSKSKEGNHTSSDTEDRICVLTAQIARIASAEKQKEGDFLSSVHKNYDMQDSSICSTVKDATQKVSSQTPLTTKSNRGMCHSKQNITVTSPASNDNVGQLKSIDTCQRSERIQSNGSNNEKCERGLKHVRVAVGIIETQDSSSNDSAVKNEGSQHREYSVDMVLQSSLTPLKGDDANPAVFQLNQSTDIFIATGLPVHDNETSAVRTSSMEAREEQALFKSIQSASLLQERNLRSTDWIFPDDRLTAQTNTIQSKQDAEVKNFEYGDNDPPLKQFNQGHELPTVQSWSDIDDSHMNSRSESYHITNSKSHCESSSTSCHMECIDNESTSDTNNFDRDENESGNTRVEGDLSHGKELGAEEDVSQHHSAQEEQRKSVFNTNHPLLVSPEGAAVRQAAVGSMQGANTSPSYSKGTPAAEISTVGAQRKQAVFKSFQSADASKETDILSSAMREQSNESSEEAGLRKAAIGSIHGTDSSSYSKATPAPEISIVASQRKRAIFKSFQSADVSKETDILSSAMQEGSNEPSDRAAARQAAIGSIQGTDTSSSYSKATLEAEISTVGAQRKRAIFRSFQSVDVSKETDILPSAMHEGSNESSDKAAARQVAMGSMQGADSSSSYAKTSPEGEITTVAPQRKRFIFKSFQSADVSKETDILSSVMLEGSNESSDRAAVRQAAIGSVQGADTSSSYSKATPEAGISTVGAQSKRAIFKSFQSANVSKETDILSSAIQERSDESLSTVQSKDSDKYHRSQLPGQESSYAVFQPMQKESNPVTISSFDEGTDEEGSAAQRQSGQLGTRQSDSSGDYSWDYYQPRRYDSHHKNVKAVHHTDRLDHKTRNGNDEYHFEKYEGIPSSLDKKGGIFESKETGSTSSKADYNSFHHIVLAGGSATQTNNAVLQSKESDSSGDFEWDNYQLQKYQSQLKNVKPGRHEERLDDESIETGDEYIMEKYRCEPEDNARVRSRGQESSAYDDVLQSQQADDIVSEKQVKKNHKGFQKQQSIDTSKDDELPLSPNDIPKGTTSSVETQRKRRNFRTLQRFEAAVKSVVRSSQSSGTTNQQTGSEPTDDGGVTARSYLTAEQKRRMFQSKQFSHVKESKQVNMFQRTSENDKQGNPSEEDNRFDGKMKDK